MKAALLYSNELKNYDFGQGHPFRGDRFQIFYDFFNERFIHLKERFVQICPTPIDDEILQLVHSQDYIRILRHASQGKIDSNIFRYISQDNIDPLTGAVPYGIEDAARLIVGSSVLAGELVAQNKFSKAIGIGGGLHHAKADYAEGFCFYNDIAVCVKYLKGKYNLQRILVLDTDAHAGNGTKEIFYDDPGVLFIDVHQDPRTIYPGTGFISEIGNKLGMGFTVNISLPPQAAIDAYKCVFDRIVIPLAEEYRPQIIMRYGGSDPHYLDSLTNLGLDLNGFKIIGRFLMDMSDGLCGGKYIDFLTSGYNLKVLPFAWSAIILGAFGLDIDLSGLNEQGIPPKDYRLSETKEMINELKDILKKYWKCMAE